MAGRYGNRYINNAEHELRRTSKEPVSIWRKEWVQVAPSSTYAVLKWVKTDDAVDFSQDPEADLEDEGNQIVLQDEEAKESEPAGAAASTTAAMDSADGRTAADPAHDGPGSAATAAQANDRRANDQNPKPAGEAAATVAVTSARSQAAQPNGPHEGSDSATVNEPHLQPQTEASLREPPLDVPAQSNTQGSEHNPDPVASTQAETEQLGDLKSDNEMDEDEDALKPTLAPAAL